MARLCFSLTVIFIGIASLWSSDSFTVLNSLLTGHVFKTIVSIDWLQCVQECHKHDMCISYNYFPPGEICELNNFAFNDRCEADDNLITANGWIHHAQEIEVKRNTTELSKHRENVTANFTCCHSMEMFADGKSLGEDNGECKVASTFLIPGGTRVISVWGKSTRRQYGIIGSFSNGLVTNESWKCSGNFSSEWNSRDYEDRHWPHAVVVGNHGIIPGISKAAKWIWTNSHYSRVYCRLDLQ